MMRSIVIAVGLLVVFSCTQQQSVPLTSGTDPGQAGSSDTGIHGNPSDAVSPGFHRKQVGDLQYSMHVMTALEFLQHKGETIASEDRKELSNESVVLLEIALNNEQKNIWNSPQLQFSEEDAVNYLVGEFASDVTIEQSGKTLVPTGTSFEGKTGAANQLYVQLFFGKLDCKAPMKLLYNDRLFGAGLIKFAINER